jgi:hypothetical protein
LPKEQGVQEVNACPRRSQVVLTSRTPRSKDLTEKKKLTFFYFQNVFFSDTQQISTGYPPSIAEKNNAGYFVKQNACLHLWAFGFSKCPIEF